MPVNQSAVKINPSGMYNHRERGRRTRWTASWLARKVGEGAQFDRRLTTGRGRETGQRAGPVSAHAVIP